MNDDRLLVIAEATPASSPAPIFRRRCAATNFDHEDLFLRRVVAANLNEDMTRELVTTVILTVAQTSSRRPWLDLDLTAWQVVALGLDEAGLPNLEQTPMPFSFAGDIAQLHDFLMHAPTPFAMLSGPEHRFSFLNQSYVDLIAQTPREEVLGRTIYAVRPELQGQPFFHLLDEVYRTQVAYVGHEVPVRLRRPHGAEYEVRHFDLIYHPVAGPDGKTSGILVQASDVTEQVLAREVSERREQQLFCQWVELDTIYRSSPAAMALFSAKDLEILRLNDRQAEWMGSPAGELVGRWITSLPFHSPLYASLLRRAAAGEEFRDYLFHDSFCAEVVPARTFRINLTPFRNAAGEIEAITSIAIGPGCGLEPLESCVQSEPEPVR